MSTTVSECGISVEFLDKDLFQDACGRLGYANLTEDDMHDVPLKQWYPYQNGDKVGFVYLMESDRNVSDLEFVLGQKQMKKLYKKLIKKLDPKPEEENQEDFIELVTKPKVFAYVWYNGTDGPDKL